MAEEPELPLEAQYLWAWFQEISRARGGNGFGPNPISFLEVYAWSTLTGMEIRPFEVEAIIAIDRCYVASLAKD